MPIRDLGRAVGIAALACALVAGRSAAQFVNPDQPDRTVTAAERVQLVQTLGNLLTERYVFPEIAERMVKRLTEREAAGAYGAISSSKELSRILSSDLAEIAHDKHLNVFYSNDPLPPAGAGPAGPPPNFAAMNYGFQKIERLPGNVGYLKFDAFMDPQGGAADVAAGAMAFLTGTDALIIDLRENGGGSPAMVAFICSYLFDGRPIHLNSLYWRPSGETQQWWTLPFVPGTRYVGKEVYVLTSPKTFSAAEEFTYNLKTQKRAAAFIPTGRAINPITKTNWEGTGIAPDLAAPAPRALEVAYRVALTKLAGTPRNPRLDRETKGALERAPTP